MNRRIIGVVAAVLLAAVGTAFLVTYVRGAEERALAGQETVEVLVVKEEVPRGTPVDELGSAVATERIPAKVRAAGSMGSLDALNGQVTAADLVPGEQLLVGRFADPDDLRAQGQIDVPEGLQEVTISIAPQRALGGRVAPGDIVGFFASFTLEVDDEEEDAEGDEDGELSEEELRERVEEASKLILNKLLVTNVQVEQLPQTPEDDDGEPSGPELAPTGNLLVTLAVDVDQAERIIFSAEYGTVWLSAQDENTSEEGSRIRTPRNIYDD